VATRGSCSAPRSPTCAPTRTKDGLTDVVEARWLTDPESADTDGDGLADAVDPSPLVRSGARQPLAEPLALALARDLRHSDEVC
jgi:hypothetical protein